MGNRMAALIGAAALLWLAGLWRAGADFAACYAVPSVWVLAVMLGSAIFSTFSLIVACLVKSRERFMGIGQVLTMPLFFASNAIYPLP